MASYNHDKYISEAIESVLNQTFKDLELIIIDDCSTDNSPKIIADYQKKDPRVRAFFHQKNMGISKTLNDCLKEVRGNFIGLIGSDDLWVENKLEKQLGVLKRDSSKIVWSEGEIINSQGIKTGKRVTEFLSAPSKKSGDIFQDLVREQFVFGQSLIFNSAFINDLRFDEELKYVNDHRFLVDLSANNQFVFMPEPLARYRLHSSNTTFKDEKGWLKDKIILRKYFLDKYIDKISNEVKADINYKIGYYLSRLGKKNEAKEYYLQALKIDHFHANSALYLVLALTGGNGFLGNLLVAFYYSAHSIPTNLSAKLPKQLFTWRSNKNKR
jgi:glycosyltransferase involved in cell wall biosynthesis